MNRKILVLVGPTSSGKTSLAIEYCKKNNSSIISADSRQIYKEMDIGTGKIPLDTSQKIEKLNDCYKIDGVEIYGYDLAFPDEYFTGYDFASYALKKIKELQDLGKKVIIVGGTGFYIDIVTGRQQLDSSEPDMQLRSELAMLDIEVLKTRLKNLNSPVFDLIDKQNPIRVIRAIEKELSTKSFKTLNLLHDTNYVYFGLTGPREYLYSRSDKWVDTIWQNGIIEETTKLLTKYPNSPKLQGLVYKSVASYIVNKESAEIVIQRIKWDIHAYIRRQQTWFKKNDSINWLDISADSQKDSILKLENYSR